MRDWGAHSYEKLSILADYLNTFAKAAGGAPNRVYLDAFAGGTQNELRTTGEPFAGSAEIAVAATPPFTHLHLFEIDAKRIGELEQLRDAHPDRSIVIHPTDCNAAMTNALAAVPMKAPTFAFLDPDGLNLKWSTVEQLANHKRAYAEANDKSKVELYILFSSQGAVRWLGKDRGPAEARSFPHKLAGIYGAWGPWERIWKARRELEIDPGAAKRAYVFLYMDRLAGLDYKYLLARPVKASGGELYVMIYATDNLAGRDIMSWAGGKERPRLGAPTPAPTLFPVEPPRSGIEDLWADGQWREDLPFDLPDWSPNRWDP